MSLFSTFALGAAQGAAQGLVQGSLSRMQSEMEEAKAKIQEARDRTMLKLQQDFSREMFDKNEMARVSEADAGRQFQERMASEGRNYQSMERENEREYQSGEKALDREDREKDRKERRGMHSESIAAQKTKLFGGEGGTMYEYRGDGKATALRDETGAPIKSAKNLSETDKMELTSIRSQIQTLMKNPPLSKKEKPDYDRQLQELRRAEARLTGKSPASAPSSTDDFLNSVLGAKG